MGLLDLLIASTFPVLKVLLITGLGTFLALDQVDILTEDARRHVNNLVFYVFNPALVASKLAETVTCESIMKMWFMPVNILITFTIGSGLGWLLVSFTEPPSRLRGLIVGCCAAGNMGSMFLIMIPAVCKEKGSLFGSPDVCQSYGLAYVSLSMAVGAIYIWTYVYNIVRASATGSEDIESARLITSTEEAHIPKSMLQSHSVKPGIRSSQAEMVNSSSKKTWMSVIRRINWKLIFAPSTIGAIVGFVIGIVPFIRHIVTGDGPLHLIEDTASLLGDGAVPTLTLILGANLLKGLQGYGIDKSMLLGIIVTRYVILPVIGIIIVKAALYWSFIPDDPLYQFILLLQYAVPPAMNIGVITQLFGAGETECSVIMLWSYTLASISLTLWSTLFMWLVS